MNIKEITKRMIEVLKDNNTTRIYAEFPQINIEELRKRIIEALSNIRGGIYTGKDIPDEEIEALADVILPGVIQFFSSDEWKVEFEAWKKEQELLKVPKNKKEDNNGVA